METTGVDLLSVFIEGHDEYSHPILTLEEFFKTARKPASEFVNGESFQNPCLRRA